MLKYILLFGCVFLFRSNDVAIEWNEALKLDWTYFKGPPDLETEAAAITASGITFGYSVQKTDDRVTGFKVNVKAHFYPDKSWYKPDKVNDAILMHERLHFDITEWHTRMLRQKIADLRPSPNISSELEKLYTQMGQTLRETQNTYDAESDHSRNIEQQFVWQKKVADELKKLEGFKE